MCGKVVNYVKQSLDIAYSETGDNQHVTQATAIGKLLQPYTSSAPDQIKYSLISLVNSLGKFGNGTSSLDLISPAETIMTACGQTYDEPTTDTDTTSSVDGSSSESTDDPRTLTKAEKAFLKAQDTDTDDDDAEETIEAGKTVCRKVGDHSAGWSRNRYIFDREQNSNDAYDAVKYLCPKYDDDLRIAKRTIFYTHNDVGYKGDDVRPGTYRTAPGIDDCYWARRTKGGNIIKNFITDHAADGVTVTVLSSDGGFTYDLDCGDFYPVAKP